MNGCQCFRNSIRITLISLTTHYPNKFRESGQPGNFTLEWEPIQDFKKIERKANRWGFGLSAKLLRKGRPSLGLSSRLQSRRSECQAKICRPPRTIALGNC